MYIILHGLFHIGPDIGPRTLILARARRARANMRVQGQYQGQYEITHVIFYLLLDMTILSDN